MAAEPEQGQQSDAAEADLFGTVPVTEQALADEQRRRDEQRNTGSTDMTGTMFGQDVDQIDIEDQINAEPVYAKGLKAESVRTGAPFKFHALRNTEKAPDMGSEFGQDIEPHGRYVTVKYDGAEPVPGWETFDAELQNPLVIEGEDTRDWKRKLADQYGKTGADLTRELQFAGHDGVITILDGEVAEIVLFPMSDVADVAERRQDTERRERINQMTPEQIQQELYRNPLTGLFNRRAFEEDLGHPDFPYIASIDVDSLKAVNDNLGHEAGDELLRVVAKSLDEHMDTGQEVYHISGDEFYVMGGTQEFLRDTIERVQDDLATMHVGSEKGRMDKVSFTYGIGSTKSDADSARS